MEDVVVVVVGMEVPFPLYRAIDGDFGKHHSKLLVLSRSLEPTHKMNDIGIRERRNSDPSNKLVNCHLQWWQYTKGSRDWVANHKQWLRRVFP